MRTKRERALRKVFNDGTRVIDGDAVRKDGHVYSKRNEDGYYEFRVRIDGRYGPLTSVPIHRLVAFEKFGENLFAKGIQVRHLNNISTDNSPDNIAIGTAHENAMDKTPETRMRTACNASMHIRKFSDDVIDEIRSLREDGASYKELMDKFGVTSKGTMSWLCTHDYKTKRKVLTNE